LAYKNALQFVADNYSNTEEGKKALEILTDQIPLLEKMEFSVRIVKVIKFCIKSVPVKMWHQIIEEN
jgi:hypothetical protein